MRTHTSWYEEYEDARYTSVGHSRAKRSTPLHAAGPRDRHLCMQQGWAPLHAAGPRDGHLCMQGPATYEDARNVLACGRMRTYADVC